MNKLKDILIEDTIRMKNGTITSFITKKDNYREDDLIIVDDDNGYLTHNVIFYVLTKNFQQELMFDENFQFLETPNINSLDIIESNIIEWVNTCAIEGLNPIQLEVFNTLKEFREEEFREEESTIDEVIEKIDDIRDEELDGYENLEDISTEKK